MYDFNCIFKDKNKQFMYMQNVNKSRETNNSIANVDTHKEYLNLMNSCVNGLIW